MGNEDEDGSKGRCENTGGNLPLVEDAVFFEVEIGETQNQADDEKGGKVKGPLRHPILGFVVFSVFHYHLANE